MSHLWMVAYDISNNKIRKTVHDHLSNHGQRVQYSVFECRLEKIQLQALCNTLNQLIEDNDKIRWYPLCHWCESDISWQGHGKPTKTDEYYLL
jgi:CRISPR-associated protein Cas2